MNTNTNQIYQYIYNKKNQRVGVLVAGPVPTGEVYLGWSLCKTTPTRKYITASNNEFDTLLVRPADKFDKDMALFIANRRLLERGGNTPVPSSIADEYHAFANRAKKYFKNKTVYS